MPTDERDGQMTLVLHEVPTVVSSKPSTSEKPAKKKGGRRHKAKGDAFERELAEHMNAIVFPGSPTKRIHRTPLSGSFSVHKGVGSADLTGTPMLWVEAKRVERLNFHEALAQAERGSVACGRVDIPVVVNRRSRQSTEHSTVCIRLDDFMKLYSAFIKSHGHQ